MNSLSWFLYLADIIGNLQGLLIAAGILTMFVGIGVFLYYAIEESKFSNKPIYYLIVALVLWLVATLIPSKQTIYLIAGSEVGEVVVSSEEGQAILNDIHEVIRAQLEELKGGE